MSRGRRSDTGAMSSPGPSRPDDHGADHDADHDVAPLGGTTAPPPGGEDDGTAGPVYPPPETEPDAGGHRPA